MEKITLGLIEVSGLNGAIAATKAATNAARVDIASAEKNDSGKITVKIEGEWQAVSVAVEAGARAADAAGEFLSMHIIAKTDSSVESILPYQNFVDRYLPVGSSGIKKALVPKTKKDVSVKPKLKPSPKLIPDVKPVEIKAKVKPDTIAENTEGLSLAELEKLPVVKLRRYARTVDGLPIFGRQISLANKQQLLEAISAVADKR